MKVTDPIKQISRIGLENVSKVVWKTEASRVSKFSTLLQYINMTISIQHYLSNETFQWNIKDCKEEEKEGVNEMDSH